MILWVCLVLLTLVQASVSQKQPQACLFVGCKCTKNYDQSIDVICIGEDGNDQVLEFPKRSDQFANQKILPVVNTFLIKRYKFFQIPDDSFRDLVIRNLIIGENQLTEISAYSFRGIKSLGLLRVIEKNLDRIEKDGLVWIGDTLNELGLWQLNFKSAYIDDFFYELTALKSLRVLNIMGYGLTEFKYAWTQLFRNVTALSLASNDLRSVDQDMFKACSNLLILDLSNNLLSNLSTIYSALRPVQFNLKELKLTGNSIEELIDFPKFPNLEILDLSFNKLKHIGDTNLFNLPKLSHLYVTNNLIEIIDQDAFKYTKNLQIVLLNSNKLKRLPHLSQLSKLKIIDLVNQAGSLKQIDDYAFERVESPLNSLSIHLDLNEIKSFGNKVFCSRYYNTSEIFNLDVSVKSLSSMNLCILKQLKSRLSTKIYLNVAVGQLPAERHAETCNCDFKAFANRNKIELVGACGQLVAKCEVSSIKQNLDDNCKDKTQFIC